jgi:hypothetical protein
MLIHSENNRINIINYHQKEKETIILFLVCDYHTIYTYLGAHKTAMKENIL